MISFLHPLYLLLLPLAALPVVLNLIRRRVRLRLPFPSLALLDRLAERRARRRPAWMEVLLLALRVAALAVLVLMVAAPRLAPRGGAAPRAVFVVVDNSPSMSYVESGGTRLARAVSGARALGAGATDDDLVTVAWTGGGTPSVWHEPGDATALLSPPPFAPGRLADVLAFAGGLFRSPAAQGRHAEVAIFTDLQRTSFDDVAAPLAALPPRTRVTIYDVRADAQPAWNVAITRVNVVPATGGQFDVTLDVRQYGRPRPVTLAAPDRGVAVSLPAAADSAARLTLPGGGAYAFACAGGYPFDDRATLTLPPTSAVSYYVAAGTPGSPYWRAALAGGGAEAPSPPPSPAIWVGPLSAWRGDAGPREFARGGGLAVVVPESAAGGPLGADAILSPLVPAAAGVAFLSGEGPNAARLGGFDVASVMPLKTDAPWRALATTAGGTPVIWRRPWGRGEVVVLAVPPGPASSNLFTSPAFVAWAIDLRLRALALAYPAFHPMTAAAGGDESRPGAISDAELRELFPGVVVTRHAPGGGRGKTVPLRGVAAAAFFALLAAEAGVAASRARRAANPNL